MRIVHLALYSTVATVANAAALSQRVNPLEQNSEHVAGISISIPESKSYQPVLTNQEDPNALVSLTRRTDDSLGETSNFGKNDPGTIPPTSADPVSSTGAISKNPSESHGDTQNGMQGLLNKIRGRKQELSYTIKNHPRHKSGFPTRVTTIGRPVRGDYANNLMNYLRSNIQISQLVMNKIKLIPLKILRSHKTLFVKVTYFNLKSSFKEKTKTIASELKQHIALTNRAITKIQKDSGVIISEVKQIHDSFIRLYPIVKKQMDELISDLKGVVGKHVLIDELEAKDGYLSTFVIEEQQHYDEIVGVLSIPLVVTELPELPKQLEQLEELDEPEELSSPSRNLEIPQPVKKDVRTRKATIV
ncbi:hypothetical protein BASA81_007256 [Batrachochytrium salamandrivorans]|nr:hypothetical protein BASA81_007256 [Batrachochytrium salamandrivorans]